MIIFPVSILLHFILLHFNLIMIVCLSLAFFCFYAKKKKKSEKIEKKIEKGKLMKITVL